jgi:hypothetical protein
MLRKSLLGFVLLALAATSGLGDIPRTMSYQGVLTDNGNPVPDGTHDFTFRIYDVPSGGTPLWTESQTLTTTDGVFDAILGSTNPLNLPFDNPYWLGIEVDGGGEMTPRVALTAAPYALNTPSGGGNTLDQAYDEGGPGNGRIITADAGFIEIRGTDGILLTDMTSLLVGQPNVSNGLLAGYVNSSPYPAAVMYQSYQNGMYLEFYDELYNPMLGLSPDSDGQGGYLYVNGNETQTSWFSVDGNTAGSGEPSLTMYGTSFLNLDMSQTGDASVQLPMDAVSSFETWDEPGIAQSVNAYIDISGFTEMTDICTATITIPAAGYVVCEATTTIGFLGTTGANWVYYQIDETAGGYEDQLHFAAAGFWVAPNASYVLLGGATRRIYFKQAGTYTFRLEAMDASEFGYKELYNSTLTLTYFPTAYGGVSEAQPENAAGVFEESQVMETRRPDGTRGTVTVVDLRELELRAARAEAEAQRLRRELAEARYRQQLAATQGARKEVLSRTGKYGRVEERN